MSATISSQSEVSDITFAHRDLKPLNIMFTADNQTPILIDFGSCEKAFIKIDTKQIALETKEKAEKNSTPLYRAPELFELKIGDTITQKTDIWSLGCILYQMMYKKSPFEEAVENGGNIAMAVLNSDCKFDKNKYSKELNNLVKEMLQNLPQNRPDIDSLIESLNSLLSQYE